MCWSPVADPNDLSSYNVPIDLSGELSGVDGLEFKCTLGLPCLVTMVGKGMAASNRLATIASGKCGATATVNTASWAETIPPASVARARNRM